MLGRRLLTAGVLIVVFVLILLFFPIWPLCAVAIGVIWLAGWEYYQMVLPGTHVAERLFYLLLAALAPVAAARGDAGYLAASLSVPVLAISTLYLFRIASLEDRFKELSCAVFGVFYVSFLLSHFLLIRALPHGKAWLFLILIVTYIGDGAAYFAGTSVGTHPLYTLLSPKKTVEGAVAGLLGCVLAAYACKYTFFGSLSGTHAFWVALALGASGQVGDLVESLLKRSVHVKDSGTLLPGHGGILDRIDSILFAGPVGFYAARLIQ